MKNFFATNCKPFKNSCFESNKFIFQGIDNATGGENDSRTIRQKINNPKSKNETTEVIQNFQEELAEFKKEFEGKGYKFIHSKKTGEIKKVKETETGKVFREKDFGKLLKTFEKLKKDLIAGTTEATRTETTALAQEIVPTSKVSKDYEDLTSFYPELFDTKIYKKYKNDLKVKNAPKSQRKTKCRQKYDKENYTQTVNLPYENPVMSFEQEETFSQIKTRWQKKFETPKVQNVLDSVIEKRLTIQGKGGYKCELDDDFLADFSQEYRDRVKDDDFVEIYATFKSEFPEVETDINEKFDDMKKDCLNLLAGIDSNLSKDETFKALKNKTRNKYDNPIIPRILFNLIKTYPIENIRNNLKGQSSQNIETISITNNDYERISTKSKTEKVVSSLNIIREKLKFVCDDDFEVLAKIVMESENLESFKTAIANTEEFSPELLAKIAEADSTILESINEAFKNFPFGEIPNITEKIEFKKTETSIVSSEFYQSPNLVDNLNAILNLDNIKKEQKEYFAKIINSCGNYKEFKAILKDKKTETEFENKFPETGIKFKKLAKELIKLTKDHNFDHKIEYKNGEFQFVSGLEISVSETFDFTDEGKEKINKCQNIYATLVPSTLNNNEFKAVLNTAGENNKEGFTAKIKEKSLLGGNCDTILEAFIGFDFGNKEVCDVFATLNLPEYEEDSLTAEIETKPEIEKFKVEDVEIVADLIPFTNKIEQTFGKEKIKPFLDLVAEVENENEFASVLLANTLNKAEYEAEIKEIKEIEFIDYKEAKDKFTFAGSLEKEKSIEFIEEVIKDEEKIDFQAITTESLTEEIIINSVPTTVENILSTCICTINSGEVEICSPTNIAEVGSDVPIHTPLKYSRKSQNLEMGKITTKTKYEWTRTYPAKTSSFVPVRIEKTTKFPNGEKTETYTYEEITTVETVPGEEVKFCTINKECDVSVSTVSGILKEKFGGWNKWKNAEVEIRGEKAQEDMKKQYASLKKIYKTGIVKSKLCDETVVSYSIKELPTKVKDAHIVLPNMNIWTENGKVIISYDQPTITDKTKSTTTKIYKKDGTEIKVNELPEGAKTAFTAGQTSFVVKIPIYEDKVEISEILEPTYYEVDKYDLDNADKKVLNEYIKFFQKPANKNLKVQIDSYCSSTATQKYNKELSKKRTMAVKAYLVLQGIDSSRIISKWHGEKIDVSTGGVQTADNVENSKNRRTVLQAVKEISPQPKIVWKKFVNGTIQNLNQSVIKKEAEKIKTDDFKLPTETTTNSQSFEIIKNTAGDLSPNSKTIISNIYEQWKVLESQTGLENADNLIITFNLTENKSGSQEQKIREYLVGLGMTEIVLKTYVAFLPNQTELKISYLEQVQNLTQSQNLDTANQGVRIEDVGSGDVPTNLNLNPRTKSASSPSPEINSIEEKIEDTEESATEFFAKNKNIADKINKKTNLEKLNFLKNYDNIWKNKETNELKPGILALFKPAMREFWGSTKLDNQKLQFLNQSIDTMFDLNKDFNNNYKSFEKVELENKEYGFEVNGSGWWKDKRFESMEKFFLNESLSKEEFEATVELKELKIPTERIQFLPGKNNIERLENLKSQNLDGNDNFLKLISVSNNLWNSYKLTVSDLLHFKQMEANMFGWGDFEGINVTTCGGFGSGDDFNTLEDGKLVNKSSVKGKSVIEIEGSHWFDNDRVDSIEAFFVWLKGHEVRTTYSLEEAKKNLTEIVETKGGGSVSVKNKIRENFSKGAIITIKNVSYDFEKGLNVIWQIRNSNEYKIEKIETNNGLITRVKIIEKST